DAPSGGNMKTWLSGSSRGGPATAALLVLSGVALSAFGGGAELTEKALAPTVPRAVCGPGDHPESALQGQVPAALRAAGYKGFNCNLQLIGQSKGDGANWQTTEFKDNAGHVCAYHGTAFTTAGRTHTGVPVIDVTNASNPTPTNYLTTTSM